MEPMIYQELYNDYNNTFNDLHELCSGLWTIILAQYNMDDGTKCMLNTACFITTLSHLMYLKDSVQCFVVYPV